MLVRILTTRAESRTVEIQYGKCYIHSRDSLMRAPK